MIKNFSLLFILFISSFVFADSVNEPMYSGELTVISIKVDSEKSQSMLDAAYNEIPYNMTPKDLLSSYGNIINSKTINFSDIKENKTTLLNKNKDDLKGLIAEFSVFKNKKYIVDYTLYSYEDGSSSSFSKEVKQLDKNYTALNGFISYPNQVENKELYTLVFVKFD